MQDIQTGQGNLDLHQVRRNFARAAARYERFSTLQAEIEQRLLEQLTYVTNEPQRILDVGSGPGTASRALKKRWPKAQVVALDVALPMARRARAQAGRWRPRHAVVCADSGALPFLPGSFDLVFSNLCVHWIENLTGLLLQWRRVLAPGGFLLASALGQETLQELRDAFAEVDDRPHVNALPQIQPIGDELLSAGFRDPVLDTDRFTLTYADVDALLRDLRGSGAGNVATTRRRGLTTPARLAGMARAYEAWRTPDGRIPASFEVIYFHAFAPEPGQPMRWGGQETASVPLSRIPIRRKSNG